jgi:recombination protein RecR
MNILPKAVTKLVESFESLPGIGPKSAQRLAFYLLHVPQEQLDRFAASVSDLKKNTVICSLCKNVAEADPCAICNNPARDHSLVCVVEQPTDVLSVERTGKFSGVYHVLHGHIDPLNSIGPDELYIADLLKRITNNNQPASPDASQGGPITEVILATNPNMEGEATAMYLTKQINQLTVDHQKVKVTRLAHGLPVGADIEYADEITLSRAFEGRREY